MQPNPHQKIDITTMATISGALGSVVNEMSNVVLRTARSPVFKLARDFSCSICDWEERQLVQGDDELPVQVGSIPLVCSAVAKVYRGRVFPGDVFLCNDPAFGGTHLNDTAILQPVFYEDALLFWTIIRAHWLDIGGVSPSDLRKAQSDIFGEGVRIAPIKIIDRGEKKQDIMGLLFDNFRFEDQQNSDLLSMMAACSIASRRLDKIVTKYGKYTFKACVEELYNRNEIRARKAISDLPDGTFEGRSYMSARSGNDRFEIQTRLTVSGARLHIALSGPAQLRDVRNSPFGATHAAAYHAAAISLGLKPPFNDGIFRAIEIDYGPLGTIVNARVPPAAVLGCTTQPFNEIIDSVRDAFNQIIPKERLTAGWGAAAATSLAGINPITDQFYAHFHPNAAAGGSGAIWGNDGWASVGSEGAGGAVQRESVELLEYEMPMLVHRLEYRTDSGGAGKWRGGIAMDCVWEPLEHEQTSRFHATIEHIPALSVGGAYSTLLTEKLGRRIAIDPDGSTREADGDSRIHSSLGGQFEMRPPGGGGVGDPFERPVERVLEDVVNGYVSIKGALLDYGVVIDADLLEVDLTATRETRIK